MELTLNKWSALFVMRSLRVNPKRAWMLRRRTGLVAPDPTPLRRWGKGNFTEGPLGALGLPASQKVHIAVPSAITRLRSSRAANTVYGSGIPTNSFLDIGDGLAISGPELLFAEMAPLMSPVEHLMLGHELCGAFGRDARDPRNGDVAYELPPLTSVERIRRFLESARDIVGLAKARKSLARLEDNAWSPTESLIVAFLRCPVDDMGFSFSALDLNERVLRNRDLPGAKGSRVPDVLVSGTKVGLNYDGLVHLDLESIARAAFDMGMNPAARHTEVELRRAMESVRAKVADDTRRNRELAVEGYTVLPVLKEDLYQRGGFDQLVARLVEALGRYPSLNLRMAKRALANRALCEDRYRLLLSLLPGKYEPDVQLGRYIAGFTVSQDASSIDECWIEF